MICLEQIDLFDKFNDAAAKAKGVLIALDSNYKSIEADHLSRAFGSSAVAALLQVASECLDVMQNTLFKLCAVANECADDIEGFDFERRVIRAQSIICSLLSSDNFETLQPSHNLSLVELTLEQVDALSAGLNKLSFD